MNYVLVCNFLLWCTLINYFTLLIWFLAFSRAHDWMFRLHGRLFSLTVAQFDALHYGGMAAYKIGILLLNLVPYVALSIVMRHAT